jgi:hypothetical protein
MMALRPRLALSLLLFFSLAACDNRKQQIVGRWQVEGGANPIVWEFSPNGAVKTGTTQGRYTFGDRGRLKIQTKFATFVYEIELAPDRMIWKEPNGSRTELKRL